MFSANALLEIGTIGKTFGVDGELLLNVHSDQILRNMGSGKFIVIKLKGDYVPYEILKWNDNNGRMSLKYISNVEEARELAGLPCYLVKADVNFGHLNSDHYSNTLLLKLNWTLIDESRGFTTDRIEIIELPQQVLASFEYDGVNIMLPLHEETILKIDPENAKIFVEIDDSIIDLYKNT